LEAGVLHCRSGGAESEVGRSTPREGGGLLPAKRLSASQRLRS